MRNAPASGELPPLFAVWRVDTPAQWLPVTALRNLQRFLVRPEGNATRWVYFTEADQIVHATHETLGQHLDRIARSRRGRPYLTPHRLNAFHDSPLGPLPERLIAPPPPSPPPSGAWALVDPDPQAGFVVNASYQLPASELSEKFGLSDPVRLLSFGDRAVWAQRRCDWLF